MINQISRQIQGALSRIRQAFRVVLGSTDPDARVQTVQAVGIGDEKLQGVEFFQQYGFTSHPQPGTMGIVIPLGGVSSHSIIIATEHAIYRLKSLRPGEVAIYTDEGAKIVLRRGKVIESTCNIFRVNCRQFEVNAAEKSQFNCADFAVQASSSFSVSACASSFSGDTWKATASSGAVFTTPTLSAGGDVTAAGDVRSGRASLNGHTHPNGCPGSTTGTPN